MHKLRYLSGDVQALDIDRDAMHAPEVRPYTETLPRNIAWLEIVVELPCQWEKDAYIEFELLEDLAKTCRQTSTSLKDVRIVSPFSDFLTVEYDLQKLKDLLQE
jgi:hypothetical protein